MSPLKGAAIVIPIYRFPLSADEEVSLACVRSVLHRHPMIFVAPNNLAFPSGFLRGEQIIRFPGRFFTYPVGYNRLLMTSRFFRSFHLYTHILVYQLDCLVFRDELDFWCSRDDDYVGSPWMDAYGGDPGSIPEWKVGNGGFSMRKISTALGILSKRIVRGQYFPVPPVHLPKPGFFAWLLTNLRRRLKQHAGLWTVEDELDNYAENEDRFWALDVMRIYPHYKKPDVDTAMRFGFEVDPKSCLERTRGLLPFGCHAWSKHDRKFWVTVLEGIP